MYVEIKSFIISISIRKYFVYHFVIFFFCFFQCFVQVDTTSKSNESPQSSSSSCSSLYVRPPDFTNSKLRNHVDNESEVIEEPTPHIIQKSLYRSHVDSSVKSNAITNSNAIRSGYPQVSEDVSMRIVSQMQIPQSKSSSKLVQSKPLTSRSNETHDPKNMPSNAYTAASERSKYDAAPSNSQIYNPSSSSHQRSDLKGSMHSIHKPTLYSNDDLYQRNLTISPLNHQYLSGSHAFHHRDTPTVVIQNTNPSKMHRHYEQHFNSNEKMSMPPMNESNTMRQTNDLSIYPRPHSANLFYHEQNRIKPINSANEIHPASSSSSHINSYNYSYSSASTSSSSPMSNLNKPNDYYNQMNLSQKWSSQSRITQSPISSASSPHCISNQNARVSQSPVSASPLPYQIHRQNPSVRIHIFISSEKI